MLKHDILSSLRTIKKNRVVSAINILGLTAGLTFVILAARYVHTERSFDLFHENHRSIYRIETDSPEQGSTCYSPNIMASWLKDTVPDVRAVTRVISDGHSGMVRNLTYGVHSFNIEKPLIVDPDFFTIFSFRLLSGETESFNRDKSSMALNSSVAERIFGDEDPIGKTLDYKGVSFTVKAVIADPPSNSSLGFDVLLPIANIPDYADDAVWTNRTLQIFILRTDGISPDELEAKIQHGFLAAVEPLGLSHQIRSCRIRLNPLHALYYSQGVHDGICVHGNSKVTLLILSMAVVVLIIALINHINASAVKTFEMNRELAIRKVTGASALDNVRLLIFELSAPCLLAFLLALQFAALLEPVVNPLLNVPLSDIGLREYAVLTAGGVLFGILSSLYPSIKCAGLNIADSLKGKNTSGTRASVFKGSLSVLQFAASIALIIALLVIYKQLNYSTRESAANFDQDRVLYMPLSDRTPTKNPRIQTIQDALKSLAEVKESASSLSLPGDEFYSFLEIPLQIKGGEENRIQVHHNMVDFGYPEVMGFVIVKGRSFNPELASDHGSYLVNETFADTYNLDDLTEIRLNGSPVVGVIKDIHFNSLHRRIEPLAIRCENSYQSRLVVRVEPVSGGSLSGVIGKIKNRIDEIDRTAVSDVLFLDRHIAALYEKENKMLHILLLLTVFSIIISCMGLFSTSLFTARSRTKEIGIRKVVGAKMTDLMLLLNRDFLKWVALAFILAVPAGWYAMDNWLNHFAYKTALNWWIFALAGVIALGVALLTVSFQTWHAAVKNPVEALREE